MWHPSNSFPIMKHKTFNALFPLNTNCTHKGFIIIGTSHYSQSLVYSFSCETLKLARLIVPTAKTLGCTKCIQNVLLINLHHLYHPSMYAAVVQCGYWYAIKADHTCDGVHTYAPVAKILVSAPAITYATVMVSYEAPAYTYATTATIAYKVAYFAQCTNDFLKLGEKIMESIYSRKFVQ